MIPAFSKKKAIRHSAERQARSYRETIEGIVWQILPEQRLARVKIQGADDLIPVGYPENLRQPTWLKVGAPVRIKFVGGCRHRGVLVGRGTAIPTPEAGAAAAPTLAAGANCVISGCAMRVAGGMHVYFEPGVIRVNDVQYDLADNWTMADTPNLTMDESSLMTMGNVVEVLEVSAADSTKFRLDAFYAGADGQIDYVVGTASATSPTVPAGPAAHVLLQTLLIPPGISEITGDLIGQAFVAPFPTAMTLEVESDQLAWAVSSTTITAEIIDQYNRPYAGTWTISATITAGSGSISGVGSTSGTSSAVFTYRRESPQGALYEDCPVFINFKLLQVPNVTNSTAILLEDELGMIIRDE